jgi:hypothetical protein
MLTWGVTVDGTFISLIVFEDISTAATGITCSVDVLTDVSRETALAIADSPPSISAATFLTASYKTLRRANIAPNSGCGSSVGELIKYSVSLGQAELPAQLTSRAR